MLLIEILGGLYLLELCMFLTPLWRQRKWVAPCLFGATLVSMVGLPWVFEATFLVAFVPLTLFRLLNLGRVLKARMHQNYLRSVTRRTALFLALYGFIGLGLTQLLITYSNKLSWLPFMLLQLGLGMGVLVITVRNVQKLTFKMPEHYLSDKNLPAVTVAIPARNETKDLEDCLRSVLASDYPKLEVLVLDDCSQARTAEIIKQFAHDGVRFVKGDEPAERWLAKNQAYEKLLQHSNGRLILFCGVDVRFGPGAIRAMVNLLGARQKKMLSVLPLRVAGEPATTLFQPMRYWWELALPRRLFNRPAVLSTCWLIETGELRKMGGFAAVNHAIMPEAYFARELVKIDSYSFVRSSEELEIRTLKTVAEQRATALRVRYPQARRRPETVLAITLVELAVFVFPLAAITTMLITGYTSYIILPAISLVLVLATHLLILQVTNPANLTIAIITFPVAVLTELFVGYDSMLRYEFGSIEWKDRNVCIPVMHTYPRLPDISA